MATPTIKDWAKVSDALGSATGRPANDQKAPSLTADDKAYLRMVAGKKMSDAARQRELGWDANKARSVAWGLRAKLNLGPSESVADWARKHGYR